MELLTNITFTFDLIEYWRQQLGEKAILSNHAFGSTSNDTIAIQEYIASIGPPIHFQPVAPGNLNISLINEAVSLNASGLEVWGPSANTAGFFNESITTLQYWDYLLLGFNTNVSKTSSSSTYSSTGSLSPTTSHSSSTFTTTSNGGLGITSSTSATAASTTTAAATSAATSSTSGNISGGLTILTYQPWIRPSSGNSYHVAPSNAIMNFTN